MLFKDKLEEKRKIIQTEFEALFNLGLSNAKHPNDLLIVVLNGFYIPYTFELANGKMSNHYVIGPGEIGHSENLHYIFIHQYRTNYISPQTHSEYLKSLENKSEKRQVINNLTEAEELTIQMEMLVYLKIWESTQFLKNLYQIVRILKGKHYEWHFKLKGHDDQDGITTAQELIRMALF